MNHRIHQDFFFTNFALDSGPPKMGGRSSPVVFARASAFATLPSSSWSAAAGALGYPHSWMVSFMENPTQMDENWGYPHDFGNPGR